MIFVHIRLIFRHIPDQPPSHIRRQAISSQIITFNPTQKDSIPSQILPFNPPKRDVTPLKKIDKPKEKSPIVDIPSQSNTLCPLCQISFDTAGIHRPVNDACGHTTCFQCFKAVMIKGTGCSLCQKEEKMNSQTSDYSVRKIY